MTWPNWWLRQTGITDFVDFYYDFTDFIVEMILIFTDLLIKNGTPVLS